MEPMMSSVYPGITVRTQRKLERKEGIAACIGGLLFGWAACGLWAKNTMFWTVVGMLPGMLAGGSLMRGFWFLAKSMRSERDHGMPYGRMVCISLGAWVLFTTVVEQWWLKPDRVPMGRFKITDSRGFGAGMTGQVLTVRRWGKPLEMILGPEKGRGETTTMVPKKVRRAVGMDCAMVFGLGEGTAFCEYDSVLGIWKVEWAGLGQDRWLLLKPL